MNARTPAFVLHPVFRKLHAGDARLVRDHLLRLGPDDRRARFHGLASDARLGEHAAGIDFAGGLVLAACLDGVPRGVAELAVIAPPFGPLGRGRAEVALTVEPAWRGHGLGTGLLRRVGTAARNRGIAGLVLVCRLDNRRAQRLTRRCGGEVTFNEDEALGRIGQPWPSLLSLAVEALDDTLAAFDALTAAPARAA